MLTTYFFIALTASIALLIKDWVETKDIKVIEANWKKYVGCIVGGLIYGYLSGVTIFKYVAIVAVIYLIGNSFNNVLNALNWLLKKLGVKKTI